MDRRELYKTRITLKNNKDETKQFLNKKRANQRDMARHGSRNIGNLTFTSGNSAASTPNQWSRKDAHLLNYQSWKNQKLSKTEERPPFITVVPVGKFIEPPSTTCLSKRIQKTQEKMEVFSKTKEPEKKISSAVKTRNVNFKVKKNKTKDIPKENLFQIVSSSKTRSKVEGALKEVNAGHRFKFIHSTAVKNEKEQGKKPKPISIPEVVSTSDEDIFDGISPLEDVLSLAPSDTDTNSDSTTIINEKTPEKENLNASLNYLSPFVSTARGKGSVRRETTTRASVYKLLPTETETEEMRKNKECALYYEQLLDDEIKRMNDVANEWDAYKECNLELSEDSKDQIDVATGQTRLLINNKFEQFRKLIVQCREMTGTQRTYPKDIEGFWGMLQIQVENIDNRYLKLESLKNNDWIEPEINVEKKTTNKVKRGRIAKKKVIKDSPRTEIRNMMKKFKNQHKSSSDDDIEINGEIFTNDDKAKSNTKNKSLLASVLIAEARKSTNAFSINVSSSEEDIKFIDETLMEDAAPNIEIGGAKKKRNSKSKKSILKKNKKNRRGKSSVNFSNENQDEIISVDNLQLENMNLNVSAEFMSPIKEITEKSQCFKQETPNTNRRRSQRTPKPTPKLLCCDFLTGNCDSTHRKSSQKSDRKILNIIQLDSDSPKSSIEKNTRKSRRQKSLAF